MVHFITNSKTPENSINNYKLLDQNLSEMLQRV